MLHRITSHFFSVCNFMGGYAQQYLYSQNPYNLENEKENLTKGLSLLQKISFNSRMVQKNELGG